MRLLLLLLIFYCLWASDNNSVNSICWSENYKLTWRDFKGVPDTTTSFVNMKAATAYQLKRDYLIESGFPSYRIKAVFQRQKSWTRDTLSIDLLSHEQRHFDIVELYARKMREGVSRLRLNKIREEQRYAELIATSLKELKAYQREYDKETQNGVIDFIQTEWDSKITKQLRALEKYKSISEDCEK
ncbi:MAG: DUF922 domain-containing protein [Cyclobacteriaceae bacterium]|nr:DUF922 domain-containing protein [Cyclobacteriaceae bacterium]